jgi:hypothetical protein
LETIVFNWHALALGQDLATAFSGAFNLLYFLHLLATRPGETPSRRIAAAALAVLSLGAAVESLFFAFISLLSLLTLPPFPWAMIRALPFAGTASISLLILRRLRSS